MTHIPSKLQTCPQIYGERFHITASIIEQLERERLHERETKGDGCQWLPIWKNVKPWPIRLLIGPSHQVKYSFMNMILKTNY